MSSVCVSPSAGALALWRQTRPHIKPQPGRYVISSATSTASIAPASSASKGSSAQESSPRHKPAVKKTWVATTWESVRNNVLVTAVWKPTAAAAEAHTVVAPLADTISGQGQQQALLGAARPAADQESTGLHPPPLQAASLLTSSSRNGLSSSVADANDIRPNSHQGRGEARAQVGSRPAPAGHVQGTVRDVKQAGKAAAGYAGQAAAYAAFVSTAKPVPWSGHQGWAYPVAQVGAGAQRQYHTGQQCSHLVLMSCLPLVLLLPDWAALGCMSIVHRSAALACNGRCTASSICHISYWGVWAGGRGNVHSYSIVVDSYSIVCVRHRVFPAADAYAQLMHVCPALSFAAAGSD